MAALTLTLKTSAPCCDVPVRLSATRGVARERYDRACRDCGKRWTITRDSAGERNGVRVDILEWAPA